MTRIFILTVLASCACPANPAMAQMVISTTGYAPNGQLALSQGVSGMAGWSQSVAYSNVSITAMLYSPDFETGHAFLTTKVGTGTTVADEIARASFTFPQGQYPQGMAEVELFSGLSLQPGNYYLTLSADSMYIQGEGWISPLGLSIATGYGVTFLGGFDAMGGVGPGYPPSLRPIYADDFWFSVTSVPEPCTLALGVFVGGSLMTWKGRRHNR